MKEALLKLADLLDIPQDVGRLKKLAKRLNLTENTVYGWVRNGKISKTGWKKIDKLAVPREQWYIMLEAYPAGRPDGGEQREPAAMTWTAPEDLKEIEAILESGQYAVAAIKKEDLETLKQIQAILASGEQHTIQALRLNITEFAEKIQDKNEARARLQRMEQEIMLNKKQLGDMRLLLDQTVFEARRHKKAHEELQNKLNRIQAPVAHQKKTIS